MLQLLYPRVIRSTEGLLSSFHNPCFGARNEWRNYQRLIKSVEIGFLAVRTPYICLSQDKIPTFLYCNRYSKNKIFQFKIICWRYRESLIISFMYCNYLLDVRETGI